MIYLGIDPGPVNAVDGPAPLAAVSDPVEALN